MGRRFPNKEAQVEHILSRYLGVAQRRADRDPDNDNIRGWAAGVRECFDLWGRVDHNVKEFARRLSTMVANYSREDPDAFASGYARAIFIIEDEIREDVIR